MTDDEILAKAEEIQARRARQNEGRAVMGAESVSLIAYKENKWDGDVHLDVPISAELEAFLCFILRVDSLTEGE